MSKLYLRPSSDYSVEMPYCSSGTLHYAMVDEEIADNDITFVYDSLGYITDRVDIYNLSGFTEYDATINNVKIYVRGMKFFSGPQIKCQCAIRTHSINYYGNENSMSTSYTTWNYTWNVNPKTGIAWTWNDIKRLKAGFKIHVITPSPSIKVTQVYVEVDYTLNPPRVPYSTFDPRFGIMDYLTTERDFDGKISHTINVENEKGDNEFIPIYLTEQSKSDVVPSLPFIELGLIDSKKEPHNVVATKRKNIALIDVNIYWQKMDELDASDYGKIISQQICYLIRFNRCNILGTDVFIYCRKIGKVFIEKYGKQVVYHKNMELYIQWYDEIG